MNARDDLAARLMTRIREGGPISLADYMVECNTHYYATRDPFGAQGDFTTAPEVSQVFGELIGAWCADYWQRMGAPDPARIVELGPGRGTLMADALRATRGVAGFHGAAKLHLVERSPVLRRLQQEKLAMHLPQFHDDIASVPPGPMLLIANEFLDALPIRQFHFADAAWHERCIGLEEARSRFVFIDHQHPDDRTFPLPQGEEGAVAEFSSAARSALNEIARRIAASGGAALFVDYGYVRGFGDTLQALRHHRPVSVLDGPGTADVTAHVDFAAMRAAAEAGGAAVHGPVTQRAFLTALGIEARMTRLLAQATPQQGEAIRAGCRRLIDPAAMGNLFKAMALTQPGAPAPEGFA